MSYEILGIYKEGSLNTFAFKTTGLLDGQYEQISNDVTIVVIDFPTYAFSFASSSLHASATIGQKVPVYYDVDFPANDSNSVQLVSIFEPGNRLVPYNVSYVYRGHNLVLENSLGIQFTNTEYTVTIGNVTNAPDFQDDVNDTAVLEMSICIQNQSDTLRGKVLPISGQVKLTSSAGVELTLPIEPDLKIVVVEPSVTVLLANAFPRVIGSGEFIHFVIVLNASRESSSAYNLSVSFVIDTLLNPLPEFLQPALPYANTSSSKSTQTLTVSIDEYGKEDDLLVLILPAIVNPGLPERIVPSCAMHGVYYSLPSQDVVDACSRREYRLELRDFPRVCSHYLLVSSKLTDGKSTSARLRGLSLGETFQLKSTVTLQEQDSHNLTIFIGAALRDGGGSISANDVLKVLFVGVPTHGSVAVVEDVIDDEIVVTLVDVPTDSAKTCDFDNPDEVEVEIELVLLNSPRLINGDSVDITTSVTFNRSSNQVLFDIRCYVFSYLFISKYFLGCRCFECQ